MIKLLRKLSQPVLWSLYKWYMSSPRWYQYNTISVRLYPTLFHPGWFLSTKTLLHYISNWDLKGKTFLELGAGSGLLAMYASTKGASTTASDINPIAVKAMLESAKQNELSFSVIESDLFENIDLQVFDYIIINPPYFPKAPVDNWDLAFYCGTGFEYFHKLFDQIHPFLGIHTQVYMILNEYCKIDTIQSIAMKNNFIIEKKYCKKIFGENQYIFAINKA